MKSRIFFTFLILFSLIFTAGCTGRGEVGQELLGPATSGGTIQKGNLNGIVLVNGKQTNEVSLIGEQSAYFGLKLKNVGNYSIYNLDTKLIGCLNEEGEHPPIEKEIRKNQEVFLSWVVRAPKMGQGEKISCLTIIRVCYDYISKGFVEIPVANERYSEEIGEPLSGSESDVLAFYPDIGILKVVNTTPTTNDPEVGHNVYRGKLTIRNIGPGWIDYFDYKDGKLDLYKLKNIELKLSKGLDFESVGSSYHDGTNPNFNYDKGNNAVFKIEADTTNDNQMKLVSGRELIIPFEISAEYRNYPNENSISFETLSYTIEHGYCTDIATINTKLSGT